MSCTHDTLLGYLSHVRDMHLRNGYQFQPTATRWLVKSALIGIRRAFGTPKRKKLAITVDMLKRLHTAIHHGNFAHQPKHTSGAVRCVWAAILVGFFAMLRKDNISSGKARTFNPSHCLIRGDLQYVEHIKAIWLRLRFSKTNQFNARAHVVPLQYTGGVLCPVTSYAAHVED